MFTRLPFGSSPAPAEFCITSKTVFNLANGLLLCNQWDPLDLPSLYTSKLLPRGHIPTNVPFGQAEEADVKLDPKILGGAEGYIEDGACVILDAA